MYLSYPEQSGQGSPIDIRLHTLFYIDDQQDHNNTTYITLKTNIKIEIKIISI